MTPQIGTFGAWLNPVYGDAAREEFAVEAEALGCGTAWLGLGSASVADLELVEHVLERHQARSRSRPRS